jgi:hypothetical protein
MWKGFVILNKMFRSLFTFQFSSIFVEFTPLKFQKLFVLGYLVSNPTECSTLSTLPLDSSGSGSGSGSGSKEIPPSLGASRFQISVLKEQFRPGRPLTNIYIDYR